MLSNFQKCKLMKRLKMGKIKNGKKVINMKFGLHCIFIFGLILLFPPSCQQGEKNKIKITSKYLLNDTLVSRILIEKKLYNEKGGILEQVNYSIKGDTTRKSFLYFPNLFIEQGFKNGLLKKEKNTKFNTHGNKVFEIILDDFEVRSYSFFFYNEENELIKSIEKTFMHNSNFISSKIIYEDEEGYINTIHNYKSSNSWKVKERKNNNEQIAEEIFLTESDSVTDIIEYNYNNKGKLTKKEHFRDNKSVGIDLYHYDSESNIIKEEHFRNDKLVIGKERLYNKNKLLKTYNYNIEKKWKAYEIILERNIEIGKGYDENGNIIESYLIEYNKDGKKIKDFYKQKNRDEYYKELRYNNFGNITEEVYYKSDNLDSIDCIINYEYEYY